MSFVDTFYSELVYQLNQSSSIPFIKDYGNAPEPTGSYCAVGVTTMNKLGRDTVQSYPTETGFEERIKQDYNVLFTFSFYGDDAFERAFETQSTLSSRGFNEDLYSLGCLSLTDATTVQRVPELRDTGFINKAVFDINVLIGFEHKSEVDWFDTVSYDGDYIDVDGTVVLTEQETVSVDDNP